MIRAAHKTYQELSTFRTVRLGVLIHEHIPVYIHTMRDGDGRVSAGEAVVIVQNVCYIGQMFTIIMMLYHFVCTSALCLDESPDPLLLKKKRA